MDLGLRGRVYLVTGGSRGLGFAAAQALTGEGARVVLSAPHEATAAAAAARLAQKGAAADTVAWVAADNADPATPGLLMAAARHRFGRLDGALISVGGSPPGTVATTTDDAWRSAFESVFLGAVRLARALAADLDGHAAPGSPAGTGGSVVFVLASSVRVPLAELSISNGLFPGLAGVVKTLDDLFQGCPAEMRRGRPRSVVKTDLDTLATALYVKTDDLLKESPQVAPWRPKVGIAPRLNDAELVTLAVMQALLGYTSESRWLRHARAHLGHLFPYLPRQPGYNKRLRAAAGLIATVIRVLAADTSLWTDDVWIVDSTPVECGRSRETVKRSDLAGWAEYGYCASHSRYFWGLRLHLIATLGGLPIGFALTGAKADERQVLLSLLAADPALVATRPGQMLIADKNYYGTSFEATLAGAGLTLLRPARHGEPERPGTRFFKPLRQVIESINDTFKGQPGLERHGGHTPAGVIIRVLQRILALTAAIWHNDRTGQPVKRSLVAYDH